MNYFLINFLDFSFIIPELFLIFNIFSFTIFLLVLSNSKIYKYPLLISSASWLAIYLLTLILMLLLNNIFIDISLFNNAFFTNYSTNIIKLILCFFTILCLLISLTYFKDEQINDFEYIILFLFIILGLFFFICAYDMKFLYLSLEIQSLSLYILVSLKKNTLTSTEAGLKYFILGSLSSILLLFGFCIIYGLTGTTNFYDLSYLFIHSYDFLNLYFCIGLFFLFSGILFKLTVVPFHMWAPDVYEGAPSSITLFISIVPKLAFIFILSKILYVYFNCLNIYFQDFFILLSLLSISVGSFLGINQKKIKRLLVYSSISHIGFLLLSLATLTFEGLHYTFFYIIIYMLMSINIWSIYLSIKHIKTKKLSLFLNDLTLLSQTNPYLSIIFTLAIFSLAGIPPLIGFFIKYLIIVSAVDSFFIISSILVLFISAISSFFYLRLVKLFYFNLNVSNYIIFSRLSKENSLIISISFLLIVFLILNSNLIFLISYKLAFFLY